MEAFHLVLNPKEVGYLMLGMREILFPTWSIREVRSGILSSKVAWYPTLEDGEVFGITLTVEGVWNSMSSFEVT